jgi:tetratricopeptide (TPR) repeat protein
MKKTQAVFLATAVMLGCAVLTQPVLAQTAAPATPADASTVVKVVAEMQRRINDGRFAAAYTLATSMPDAQGDPHFDFLYGVAAVNVGRTAEAVLALQRHLAVVPGNDRARLDLARAYFDLGDDVRARQEFEFVLRYNPPADVQANIRRYLDSMQVREGLSGNANARLYGEVGFGHDSNANMGTYNTTIDAPLFAGTAIDPTSQGQPSDFAWVAAGGRWVRQVSGPFGVYAGADMDNKMNQDTPQFNTANLSGYAGFSMVSGPVLYRLSLSDAVTYVNALRYSGRLGTSGEAQYAVGDGLTLSGRLQYAEQSYSPENSYRDATLETYGVAVEQALSVPWRPALGLQLSQAMEDNLSKRRDLSRQLDTWRLSASLSPSDKLGVMLAYSEQQATYQAIDAGFGNVRGDKQSTLDLVISYALDANWTLRADVQQMENKSNQSLYSFQRTMGGIKLRYGF